MLKKLGGKFEDVSDRSGTAFLEPQAARGVAFGHFNNDGFIDIAANIDDGPPVLRNGRTNLRWILIDTIGSSSNHDGIGARMDMVGQ